MMRQRDLTVEYRDSAGARHIHTETYATQNAHVGGCIVLHSGPGFGAGTMRPGIEAIAETVPMTILDLPGCGRSSRHAGSGYPLQAYIEDVLQVRQALGLVKPLLLGHGWGAILAVESALANPAAFGGLLLVNPMRVLNTTGQDAEAQQRQVQRVDETLLHRFTTDVLPPLQQAMQGLASWDDVDRNPWWPQMWLTQWAKAPSQDWLTAVAGCTPGMEAYFAHKGQAMFDPQSGWASYDLASRIPDVKGPIHVVASAHDANYVALPQVHVEPLRAARPDLQVEIVSDAGHFLTAEAPALVSRHLKSLAAAQRTFGRASS